MNRLGMISWYVGTLGSVAFMPFMGAVLEESGWSAAAMVSVFVFLPVASLVGGPLWSRIAENTGRPVLCLRIAVFGLVITTLLLTASRSYVVVFLSMALFAGLRSAVTPIGDALVVSALGNSTRYGALRAWGSVAFLAVVLFGGILRDSWEDAPFLMALCLLVPVVIVVVRLREPAEFGGERVSAIAAIISDRVLVLALVVGYLHGIGIATYDFMFSVHIERLGLSSGVTGAAFALGVFMEILVLRAGRSILERYGPRRVLLLGVLSGVPRWFLTGLVEDPVLLIAVQSLHGLTFGAFWMAGVSLFSDRLPSRIRSSAQAVWSASVFGAGVLTGLLLAVSTVPWLGTAGAFYVSGLVSGLASFAAWRLATGPAREVLGVGDPASLRRSSSPGDPPE